MLIFGSHFVNRTIKASNYLQQHPSQPLHNFQRFICLHLKKTRRNVQPPSMWTAILNFTVLRKTLNSYEVAPDGFRISVSKYPRNCNKMLYIKQNKVRPSLAWTTVNVMDSGFCSLLQVSYHSFAHVKLIYPRNKK